MSRYGLIYCAYDTADLVPASLQPWVDARRAKLGGHEFRIAAVCVPFAGFPREKEPDSTQTLLEARLAAGDIDHLITSETPMAETEARGQALRWLVDADSDVTIMVDSDEVYQMDEIQRVAAFVAARPHVAAFRGSLKNYVFDNRTYLTQPFTPMRIHRVRVGGYQAHSFWDDNNVTYGGTITRDLKRDIEFPCVTIPKVVAFARHLTWLNDGPNGRSHRKVRYQEARQWKCDFAWDDSRGGLIWRDGVTPPETARDPEQGHWPVRLVPPTRSAFLVSRKAKSAKRELGGALPACNSRSPSAQHNHSLS